MSEEMQIRCFRILLIINKFSKDTLFKSELKLQKLEFFMRNMDHLICFLLSSFLEGELNIKKEDLKKEVDFMLKDPLFKSKIVEMKKFKYGAYEELDTHISLLKSLKLLRILGSQPKVYQITSNGIEYLKEIEKQENLLWYYKMVDLLYKYFGDILPTDLKNIQYKSDEYLNARWNTSINNEFEKLKVLYNKVFQEDVAI
ncbi:MAG: hypothetical protein ACRC4T_12255 [Cetobacterium sp.]